MYEIMYKYTLQNTLMQETSFKYYFLILDFTFNYLKNTMLNINYNIQFV